MCSDLCGPRVHEIKTALLEFHKNKGFKIFAPFPIVSTDPTVMFVNATITPFKPWFVDNVIQPSNYALIQGCLRIGGASELDIVGVNPYYFTFFEMFGSGVFNATHEEAVFYLLELLTALGIEKERLYFTIPISEDFHLALRRNGVEERRIFQLAENGYFWQEWKFGVPGPLGHGLTVIFSRSSEQVESVEQLASDQDRWIELLNLIHIHSQNLPNGELVPIPNSGFDLGVGIERLAAVLQKCDSYHIDNIFPLVQTVADFLSEQKGTPDNVVARICADHFRAIYVLSAQGLMPSNKRHGYILRKLIRRFIEMTWSTIGKPVQISGLIQRLSDVFESQGYVVGVNDRIDVADKVSREEKALLSILRHTEKIIRQHPEASPQTLYDTYGISKALLRLAQQQKHKKGGVS